ncbi:hypothetical protein OsJ_11826 [Oryza sativa Japonica Group]|uniref:Uncharacterized protein n=1 Tax=Oryza sativa subsp. japonica TaxID=39947 RepID=B9F9V0_ORYSJ|nr:hypothetical protein OsJ_11826 [Oryza sativa Japonica Group]
MAELATGVGGVVGRMEDPTKASAGWSTVKVQWMGDDGASSVMAFLEVSSRRSLVPQHHRLFSV